jgi:hypothetical protein
VDKKSATEIALEPEKEHAPSLSHEQRMSCPDCAGTNFWYPEGPDKGVARCQHTTLIAAAPVVNLQESEETDGVS